MELFFQSLLTLLLIQSIHAWLFNPSPPDPFENDMTKFKLYRRRGGAGKAVGEDYDTMSRRNFDSTLPTKFYIHGWLADGSNWYVSDMRQELIKYERCNFIEVDWSAGSMDPNYFTASASAQQAGRDVASFVHWLHQNFQLPYSNVHIIGHSLGGQAAGAAGREIQNPKIARISGLDPAQPGFNMSDPNDTLGSEDADFVDNIHTTFVSTAPMGHVDFYPNGGHLGVPVLTWLHSHYESSSIYAESINGHCSYTAYKCSNYEALINGGCQTSCPEEDSCNQMGYHATPEGAMGSLQLQIRESSPYC